MPRHVPPKPAKPVAVPRNPTRAASLEETEFLLIKATSSNWTEAALELGFHSVSEAQKLFTEIQTSLTHPSHVNSTPPKMIENQKPKAVTSLRDAKDASLQAMMQTLQEEFEAKIAPVKEEFEVRKEMKFVKEKLKKEEERLKKEEERLKKEQEEIKKQLWSVKNLADGDMRKIAENSVKKKKNGGVENAEEISEFIKLKV